MYIRRRVEKSGVQAVERGNMVLVLASVLVGEPSQHVSGKDGVPASQ